MEYLIWFLIVFFGFGIFTNIFLGDFGSEEDEEDIVEDNDESFLDLF